jgi:phage shock protein E
VSRITLALLLSIGLLSSGISADSKAPPPAPPAQPAAQQPAPPNPNIDMDGFLNIAREAALHREKRRLTEDDFLKMAAEPGTIVLDARSKEKYDLLHIKGAINLSFPDIAIDSLKQTLPDKEARILIYCNNNFKNAEKPFPSKAKVASLNISTYISLYSYGYRNIYELGPVLDPAKSKLIFESSPR